jgi:hypothetical protein
MAVLGDPSNPMAAHQHVLLLPRLLRRAGDVTAAVGPSLLLRVHVRRRRSDTRALPRQGWGRSTQCI